MSEIRLTTNPLNYLLMRLGLHHALPVAAGIAVGWSDLHPACAPLQALALAAFAWSLTRAVGPGARLGYGLCFGAAMAGMVLTSVRLPPVVMAILFFGTTAWWAFLGWPLSAMLGRRDPRGCWAAAGVVVLGEWAQSSALPLFGTAQRFASAWVDYAFMLPLSRLGGTLLTTLFLCGFSFSLVLAIVATARDRVRLLRIAGVLVLSITLLNLLPGREQEYRTTRIAVIGARDSMAAALKKPEEFWRLYGPHAEEAAARGATLVVFPELALSVSEEQIGPAFMGLAAEAKRLGVTFAVGFHQLEPHLNRSVFLNTAEAPVSAHYDKTYWVPEEERYDRRGDGAPVVATTVDGTKVGLMICQDDNFEEVSRRLSMAGVQVATVPTLDWKSVERVHLNNARNRPREFGFAAARAAIGGISALIDAEGRVVASMDHLVEGDGLVIADVPVPAGGPTFFAHVGNMPTLVLAGMGVWAWILGVLRNRHRELPKSPHRDLATRYYSEPKANP